MKTCALVIGHKPSSPGAVNLSMGITEYEFNDALSSDIKAEVIGVDVVKVYRTTYKSLPSDINRLGPDFIISLHCNAYNTTASGTEVLFYHTSKTGRQIAGKLNEKLVQALGLKDRGIKPINGEDRGGYLLKLTQAPCVIAEPFFIDNDTDITTALGNRDGLVSAYARAIETISRLV